MEDVECATAVELVPVITVMQDEAERVACHSGNLLSFVRQVVNEVVGCNQTPRPPEAEEEKARVEPLGLVGLTRAHLDVIDRNIAEITLELQRL